MPAEFLAFYNLPSHFWFLEECTETSQQPSEVERASVRTPSVQSFHVTTNTVTYDKGIEHLLSAKSVPGLVLGTLLLFSHLRFEFSSSFHR